LPAPRARLIASKGLSRQPLLKEVSTCTNARRTHSTVFGSVLALRYLPLTSSRP